MMVWGAAEAQDRYPGSSFPSPYNYRPLPAPPRVAPAPAAAGQEKEQPIYITADHVEQLGEPDKVKAWGRVRVLYGKRVVKADRIIINTKTGKGQATGHVVILAEDGTRLRATKAQIDIKSKKGRMFNAQGILGSPKGIEYYVKGKRRESLQDQESLSHHLHRRSARLADRSGRSGHQNRRPGFFQGSGDPHPGHAYRLHPHRLRSPG
ncbi:MAG: hypothetical protein ACE5ER_08135 [Nitrospinaceae bacterium]